MSAMSVVLTHLPLALDFSALSDQGFLAGVGVIAGIYFLVMAVRLLVSIVDNGADFWREGAIPVAFHWVLALFILVSGRRSEAMGRMRMPAEDRDEYEEADDIAHGDVPALAQPLAYGFGLRKEIGYGDAR